MKITEVTVVAKYSLDTGHGWKAIEVGATATLTSSDETLESAQQELYQRLTTQLKSPWNNGNGRAETQSLPRTRSGDNPVKPRRSPATTRQPPGSIGALSTTRSGSPRMGSTAPSTATRHGMAVGAMRPRSR